MDYKATPMPMASADISLADELNIFYVRFKAPSGEANILPAREEKMHTMMSMNEADVSPREYQESCRT